MSPQKIVPLSAAYQAVANRNKIATTLLYSSTILSLGIAVLEYLKIIPDLRIPLTGINILFICLYAYLDNRAHYLFTKAEMGRRLDWLDNSFGTNFSGKKSKGYYTNDQLSAGLYKLAVNCFENSHHTHFIISKMLPRVITQTIGLSLIFVVSAYVGNREIFSLFFELALPLILIQKLIKAVIFSSRMADVNDRFKALFNDLLKSKFDDKHPEVLRDLLEYETALAWASLPLDSGIFEKHKDALAKDWDDMKKEYQIA